MLRITTAAATAAICAVVSGFAVAATINPNDFDRIYTESRRTTTVDGADVSGHGWNGARNSDIKAHAPFNIGPLNIGDDVLLVGAVTTGGTDPYFSSEAFGQVSFSVLNIGFWDAMGGETFGTTFEIFIDGVLEASETVFALKDETNESLNFATFDLDGSAIDIIVSGAENASYFDLGISVVDSTRSNEREELFDQNDGDDIFVLQARNLISGSSLSAVPVPAPFAMMLGGFGFLGLQGWRRRRGRTA